MQNAYLKLRTQKVPEERLELLRIWIEDAKELEQRAMAEEAAKQEMAEQQAMAELAAAQGLPMGGPAMDSALNAQNGPSELPMDPSLGSPIPAA
jgi:hypothetical protein